MSQSGFEQRFTTIYTTYIDDIYRFIYLRTGMDKAIAEDITQDVFVDAYRGLYNFKGLSSEKTWLFRIARNKVYDYYRKHYKEDNSISNVETCEMEQLADPSQDIEYLLEKSLDSKCLLDSLNTLPQHYKIVLLLKYADGRSVKEISRITDKSAKAIDNILQRAKAALIKQYRSLQKEAN